MSGGNTPNDVRAEARARNNRAIQLRNIRAQGRNLGVTVGPGRRGGGRRAG